MMHSRMDGYPRFPAFPFLFGDRSLAKGPAGQQGLQVCEMEFVWKIEQVYCASTHTRRPQPCQPAASVRCSSTSRPAVATRSLDGRAVDGPAAGGVRVARLRCRCPSDRSTTIEELLVWQADFQFQLTETIHRPNTSRGPACMGWAEDMSPKAT